MAKTRDLVKKIRDSKGTATEISGEITPERMKGWSQGKNNTQLCVWLVIEARSNAVKSNIALEPEMSGP